MWEIIKFEERKKSINIYLKEYYDDSIYTLYSREDAKRLHEISQNIWLNCNNYMWILLNRLKRWKNILWEFQRTNNILPHQYIFHIKKLSRKEIENILITINNELIPIIKRDMRKNRKNLIKDCFILRNALINELKNWK